MKAAPVDGRLRERPENTVCRAGEVKGRVVACGRPLRALGQKGREMEESIAVRDAMLCFYDLISTGPATTPR